MIAAYLLLAIVAASIASVSAFLLGSSLLLAFGVYTLVGTLTLIILPLMAMLIGAMTFRREGQKSTHRRSEASRIDLGAPSIHRV